MTEIAQHAPYRMRSNEPAGASRTPNLGIDPSSLLSSLITPGAACADLGRGVVSLVKQRARRVQARPTLTIAARDGQMTLTRAVTLRATIAESADQIAAATNLIRRRYAWRGYDMPEQEEDSLRAAFSPDSNQIVFMATANENVLGTITLGLDGSRGLCAETSYADVVQGYRAGGKKVAEVTRLAVAEDAESKPVLAALFSLAWAAGSMNGVTDMFVEVNPRHVVFYRRMLGFEVTADERFCERVRAPSVLLRVDMNEAEDRLVKMNARLSARTLEARAA